MSKMALGYHTDKGPQGHNYTPAYDRHFRPLRHEPIALLEIGTQTGESLLLWQEYFEKATIVGVDIAPIVEICTERVTTVVCDVNDYRPDRVFSIIVDDGSHYPADVVGAMSKLWRVLYPGGWYVIEDMHCEGLQTILDPDIHALFLDGGRLAEIHVYPKLAMMRKAL